MSADEMIAMTALTLWLRVVAPWSWRYFTGGAR